MKKETLVQVFSCEFYEISKNTFFCKTPLDDYFCTDNSLSYPLGLRGEKSQWKTGMLLKIDIYSKDDTSDTSKPGSFNSLKSMELLS